jgi:hypothetical protein
VVLTTKLSPASNGILARPHLHVSEYMWKLCRKHLDSSMALRVHFGYPPWCPFRVHPLFTISSPLAWLADSVVLVLFINCKARLEAFNGQKKVGERCDVKVRIALSKRGITMMLTTWVGSHYRKSTPAAPQNQDRSHSLYESPSVLESVGIDPFLWQVAHASDRAVVKCVAYGAILVLAILWYVPVLAYLATSAKLIEADAGTVLITCTVVRSVCQIIKAVATQICALWS